MKLYGFRDISEWLFIEDGRPLLDKVIDYHFDENVLYKCDGIVCITIRTQLFDDNNTIIELLGKNDSNIELGRTRRVKYIDGHFEKKCEYFKNVKLVSIEEDCGCSGDRFTTYCFEAVLSS